MRSAVLLSYLLLACCWAQAADAPADDVAAMLERAWRAHGGEDALQKLEGGTVHGLGQRDLGILHQDRQALASEPVRFEEWMILDGDGSLGYESRGKVNADADEWLRMVHRPDGWLLIADRLNQRAFWVPGGNDQAQRLRRGIPLLLLAELRASPEALTLAEKPNALKARLEDGSFLELHFSEADSRLHAVEYALDAPMYGPTRLRWEYSYADGVSAQPGLPSAYRILLGGKQAQQARLAWLESPSDAMEGLPGIEVPKPPTDAPPAASVPDVPAPPPSLRDLGEELYLVPNVRSGFHALVVELDEGVLVVDAPAGYHELRAMPAIDWADAAHSAAVGERLLQAARQAVPGKPVRWVVATHHHGDHIGGLQPFIDAGVTVLAAPPTVAAVRALPKGGQVPAGNARIDIVHRRMQVGSGRNRVELIDVGENPHAEGMLVVWLPERRALYQSDLFFPSSQHFPDRARLPVMQWFVGWLADRGLEPEQIYSIHGSARVTDEQLEQIRNSGR